MAFLDTAIVFAIVLLGLFLFYRALKEPMDMLFSFIGKIFSALKNTVTGDTGTTATEVIKYG